MQIWTRLHLNANNAPTKFRMDLEQSNCCSIALARQQRRSGWNRHPIGALKAAGFYRGFQRPIAASMLQHCPTASRGRSAGERRRAFLQPLCGHSRAIGRQGQQSPTVEVGFWLDTSCSGRFVMCHERRTQASQELNCTTGKTMTVRNASQEKC